MNTLVIINVIACGLAGVGCLIRLVKGPTALDRAVAIDVLTAVVVGLVAWTLIASHRSDVGVIFIILAVVSFLSSTVIGRFGGRYRGDLQVGDGAEGGGGAAGAGPDAGAPAPGKEGDA
ncbi:MAG: monovalent cation/H+ antiporter complex subunit F [Actinomycetaceae bacterium]|nr:monovalent cation/H+ antiporter complex subunit F [Actinomycetaceae bacterium]MDU0970867.1 monovalent cation/H+ antiporter complex subunit F [Actinomycetaceae bacterium]